MISIDEKKVRKTVPLCIYCSTILNELSLMSAHLSLNFSTNFAVPATSI